MILKNALKNPILMIGILIFSISLMDANRRGVWKKVKNRFNPTSCRAVLVKLQKAVPQTWTTDCNDNNLEVVIDLTKLDPPPSLGEAERKRQHQIIMYRELANNLSFIAQNSPLETLERVYLVVIRQQSNYLQINSITEGKNVAKLATLKEPQFIRQLLQSTVKTQEKILRNF